MEDNMNSHSNTTSGNTTTTTSVSLDVFLSSIYRKVQEEMECITTTTLDTISCLNVSPTLPTTKQKTKLNAILGNEAGDADSIVSSIGLAYVLHLKQQIQDDEEEEEDRKRSVYSFPIVSIPRKDLKLRNDVTLLLSLCQISSSTLENSFIFIDDFLSYSIKHTANHNKDWSRHHHESMFELTLVDHNKIQSSLEYLQQYVNQIYDHHYDEGYHTHVQIRNIAYDSSKKVALVGSTCTLVTEELQHVLLQQEYGRVTTTTKREIHPTLSLALLSVILLDTMNMNFQAGRGTQRDQHSIDFLIQYTCWDFFLYPQKEEGEKAKKKNDFVQSKFSNYYSQIFIHEKNINTNRVVPNCTALYELLQNCKFDEQFWLELSVEDTLRIDYKTFTHSSKKNKESSSSSSSLYTTSFGLSSILLSCSTLQEKNHFIISTLDFIQQQQIQLLGILSLVIDEKTNIPKREILFFGPENIIQSLIQYLMTREDASFLNLYDTNNTTTTTTARFHSIENTINPKIYIHETGDTDDRFMIITLQQGNSKASRKQIAPVIQSFFSSIG